MGETLEVNITSEVKTIDLIQGVFICIWKIGKKGFGGDPKTLTTQQPQFYHSNFESYRLKENTKRQQFN